ncbi:hypothetical protein EJB05_45928, partial [Eragrostis curvula]
MAVTILESCMVTPSEETPRHGLWLSNLDLMVARSHTSLVLVYKPGRGPASCFSPDVLKASLSKALVPFYPLAGRLAEDRTGRPEIRCTGDGVLFVAARIDATLDDMRDLVPSGELRRMFVLSADGEHSDILVIVRALAFMVLDWNSEACNGCAQATLFRCGALCLATSFHRLAADGGAIGNFLNTWAAIARGFNEAVMPRPCLDRTLLRARSPPAVRFDHTDVYSWRGGGGAKPKVPFEAAILPISRFQADALKGSAQGKKVTTFSTVVAHVWRCACTARGLAGTEDTRLYMTAEARSRVRPPLPDGYLGNTIVRASAVDKVDAIISGSLSITTSRISKAIAMLKDEFIRSLVDYAELATSDPEAAADLRIQEWTVIPETDLWVVSWLGVTFSDVDFGWGRPSFIRPATIQGGAVFLIPSPDCHGGIDVAVAMEPERLARFKELFYEGLQRHPPVSSDTHAADPSKF